MSIVIKSGLVCQFEFLVTHHRTPLQNLTSSFDGHFRVGKAHPDVMPQTSKFAIHRRVHC
jgi:hypothetical protein